jgi:hypothetical protein
MELKHLNGQKNPLKLKNGLKRHFAREKILMFNKYIKMFNTTNHGGNPNQNYNKISSYLTIRKGLR